MWIVRGGQASEVGLAPLSSGPERLEPHFVANLTSYLVTFIRILFILFSMFGLILIAFIDELLL